MVWSSVGRDSRLGRDGILLERCLQVLCLREIGGNSTRIMSET